MLNSNGSSPKVNPAHHAKLGAGSASDAYRSSRYITQKFGPIVFKVVQQARGSASTKVLADEAVWACEVLRNHHLIKRIFGPIVPRSWSPRPGVIAQDHLPGVRYFALQKPQQATATSELRRWEQICHDILGTADAHIGNFLFDQATGRISSAFDPIASTGSVFLAKGRNFTVPNRRPE